VVWLYRVEGRGKVIEQCYSGHHKEEEKEDIRGIGAGIAQSVERLGCKLDDRAIEVDFLCSISSPPPSYLLGIRGISPGVKWPEREADRSTASSADV
jgi:hypothetical protein